MKRKSFLIGIMRIFSIVILLALPILAQTQSDPSQTEQEEPAFSNPAQAAHAQNLANAVAEAVAAGRTDVDPNADLDSIAGMRAEGMGWGQIAHEIGVHPGTLGLGHVKGKNAQTATETQLATARDKQTGGFKGHGMSSSGASGGKSSGHGHASSGHGGKGGDHGDGGGHGGGHGGGNGGGQGGGNGNK